MSGRATTGQATTRVLGGLDASLAIARVTLTRTLRGSAVWVALALAALPLLWAPALRMEAVADYRDVLVYWALLLVILPPVLLAPAISEEIEERTTSYLWSRPIPRWSIVVGKMIALVPILWLALGLAALAPFLAFVPGAGAHPEVVARLVAMVLLGTLGAAAITVGLTTIVPRHGTIVAIAYLLFVDSSLSAIGLAVSRVSVLYNAIELAGLRAAPAPVMTPLLWLLGWIAAWMALAVWRIRRLE
jgi:ABC-type transport system involved in multi-copper enzyme maturation permease subunit